MSNTTSTLMTEGTIWKRIITFAFPLFWGNLFQQLYNTADSLIVGNFLGDAALAAVSSSGSLIFLMVGFFNGISIVAGVVIARYFGARDICSLKKAIHTTIAFGLICGCLLTLVGVFAAPQILVWMGTPSAVLPNSITYFRIYFCGSLAFVMYNIFVGILQSVGDSRHPLIYLVISSAINITLDLFFIGVLHYGVGGAALATVISQFISVSLCLRQLLQSPEEFRISFRKIHLEKNMLQRILTNGLPAGFQNSIISVANVFVQANINQFGQMAVAGCGAYSKIQGFGFLPMTAGIAELMGRGVVAVIAARQRSYLGICMASPIAWILAAGLLIGMYFYIMKVYGKKLDLIQTDNISKEKSHHRGSGSSP